MRLGIAIQYLRFSEKKTKHELAQEIGVSPSTVARIEAGQAVEVASWMKVMGWLTEGTVETKAEPVTTQDEIVEVTP